MKFWPSWLNREPTYFQLLRVCVQGENRGTGGSRDRADKQPDQHMVTTHPCECLQGAPTRPALVSQGMHIELTRAGPSGACTYLVHTPTGCSQAHPAPTPTLYTHQPGAHRPTLHLHLPCVQANLLLNPARHGTQASRLFHYKTALPAVHACLLQTSEPLFTKQASKDSRPPSHGMYLYCKPHTLRIIPL